MSVAHKEKLIDLVKLNPGLWKQSRKAPGLKQQIWDEIGTELGTTGYDARRQWEILRDQLRRENKRFKQNPHYKSKWAFYTRMQFTLPQNDAAASGCSDDGELFHFEQQQVRNENFHCLTPKTEEEQSSIQVRKDLQDKNDGPNQFIPSDIEGYCTATVIGGAPVTASGCFDDYFPSTSAGVSSSTQLPRYSKDTDNSETDHPQNRRYSSFPEDDEDYYFAMSLIPSLRCISRAKKLRVRSKIMDLIASVLDDETERVEITNAILREDIKSNIRIQVQDNNIPTDLKPQTKFGDCQ